VAPVSAPAPPPKRSPAAALAAAKKALAARRAAAATAEVAPPPARKVPTRRAPAAPAGEPAAKAARADGAPAPPAPPPAPPGATLIVSDLPPGATESMLVEALSALAPVVGAALHPGGATAFVALESAADADALLDLAAHNPLLLAGKPVRVCRVEEGGGAEGAVPEPDAPPALPSAPELAAPPGRGVVSYEDL